MRLENRYLIILGQNCIHTILNWVISWQQMHGERSWGRSGGKLVIVAKVFGNYMKIVRIY
jgi:hypothetical protein